jgi:protein CpxP
MMTKFAGRHMKRTAAVLLCTAALALPALAQSGTTGSGTPDQTQGPPAGRGPGGRGGGPEQRLEMMTTELSLTPDQVAKIKPILEASRKQMMELRESSAPQEDRRAKMMALTESESTQVKAQLTDDQKPKYDVMLARMRERMRDRGGNGGGTPPPPPPPPPPPAAPQQ